MCNLEHGISKIVGIRMGSNCVSLIADLVFYCYERDFISYLNRSKQYNLRSSVAQLHTLSKLCDVPFGFVPPPLLMLYIALFNGRRKMDVFRYRMICLDLLDLFNDIS